MIYYVEVYLDLIYMYMFCAIWEFAVSVDSANSLEHIHVNKFGCLSTCKKG